MYLDIAINLFHCFIVSLFLLTSVLVFLTPAPFSPPPIILCKIDPHKHSLPQGATLPGSHARTPPPSTLPSASTSTRL